MMPSQKTLKLPGWQPQAQPAENNDIQYHRQLLIEIVFGLYHKKKEILAKMGMPPQPVSLLEIWHEYLSRRTTLESIKKWKWPKHTKRWIDRRVNEAACPSFYADRIPKIVAATAGMYEPNPKLFERDKTT